MITDPQKNEAVVLSEIEQLIRSAPEANHTSELNEWLGRAQAAINRWNVTNGALFRLTASQFQNSGSVAASLAPGNWSQLLTMLHEARSDIRSRIAPPVTEVFDQGQRFEYFDEVRKLIEVARTELLFVDPYIDAEFVARYLPLVRAGVVVRLLTYKCLKTLLPAADLFSQQYGLQISIRSDSKLHDRFLIVDRRECYFSGGSFKDGAKNAPALLMQITDAFDVVNQKYEDAWSCAKSERA